MCGDDGAGELVRAVLGYATLPTALRPDVPQRHPVTASVTANSPSCTPLLALPFLHWPRMKEEALPVSVSAGRSEWWQREE